MELGESLLGDDDGLKVEMDVVVVGTVGAASVGASLGGVAMAVVVVVVPGTAGGLESSFALVSISMGVGVLDAAVAPVAAA